MTVIKLEHQELRIRSWFNWWDASKYLGLISAYVGVGNVFILHLCNLKKKKKKKNGGLEMLLCFCKGLIINLS